MRNLEKGPQMREGLFQDDQPAMVAEWDNKTHSIFSQLHEHTKHRSTHITPRSNRAELKRVSLN